MNLTITKASDNDVIVQVTPSATQYVAIDRGLTGQAGQGVPTGGTTGQILTKNSNADYDDIWKSNATLDYLQLNTASAASIALGELRWNSTNATAAFGIIDGTVECNIGEQMFAYVTNADSVTIAKGQPVYLYRATGNRASVKLASNLGDATSAKTLGLATQSIAPNQIGFITTQGVLDKIDTSDFAEGDTLYLGATAGTLTNVKPQAPNHLVYIGVVERANNGNGQIYVKPQNGYELSEIHDVQIIDPVNGQTIIYDSSTSLWKNASPMTYPSAGIANSTGTSWGTSYSITGTGNVVLDTRPTLTVTGAGFTLQDATDNTKQANFVLSGITTATTRAYTLPNASVTLAGINLAQSWTGLQTFGTGITSSSTNTFSNTTTNFTVSSQTTGLITIGGTAGTGIITVGQSTGNQTTNIQAGVTASGSTKTINIGTNGAAGSTTNIAIGSTTGTSTTTFNGITKSQTYLVANLPSASTSGVGARAFVTNALTPTWGATVVTGGAVAVPVYSDGTNWKVG